MRNRRGGNGAYQFGQPGIVHVQPYAWMYMYMYVHTTHVFGSNSFGVAVCLYYATWTPIEGEVSVMGEKVLLHPEKRECMLQRSFFLNVENNAFCTVHVCSRQCTHFDI